MRLFRLRVLVVLSTLVLQVFLALPAMAAQFEGGSINCGSLISYVHLRFNDTGRAAPAGTTSTTWIYTDSNYHTKEANGAYSGGWTAYGWDWLDTGNTWAGCRNFG